MTDQINPAAPPKANDDHWIVINSHAVLHWPMDESPPPEVIVALQDHAAAINRADKPYSVWLLVPQQAAFNLAECETQLLAWAGAANLQQSAGVSVLGNPSNREAWAVVVHLTDAADQARFQSVMPGWPGPSAP